MDTFSLFQSSKNGAPDVIATSRSLVTDIKSGRLGGLGLTLQRLIPQDQAILKDFINQNSILVPIPGSAPLISKDALWVPREICRTLFQAGYGLGTYELLSRLVKVPKAAFQSSAQDRPTVNKHFGSIGLNQGLLLPTNQEKEFVLIDDIVTQGRTAIACMQHIKNHFGEDTNVRLFTVIRTNTFNIIDKVFYPLSGTVDFNQVSGNTRHNF